MTRYLLDTNLLSEVLRQRPDPGVFRRLHALPKAHAMTSATDRELREERAAVEELLA